MTTFFTTMASPIGPLVLTAGEAGLTGIYMEGQARFPDPARRRQWVTKKSSVLDEAWRQLEAYFAGELKDFDLAMDFAGTDFEHKVWEGLRQIPYGETRSYQDLAISIGHPKAQRAVGLANGRNPLPIIVPCHRVIAKSGGLGGYGGGCDRKSWLLDHERRVTNSPSLSCE